MDVERAILVESLARLALIAWFHVGSRIHAVDCFGKNARACRFANTTRAAKQISLRQMFIEYGILQGDSNRRLTNNTFKCCRTILSCRYYKFTHAVYCCGKYIKT